MRILSLVVLIVSVMGHATHQKRGTSLFPVLPSMNRETRYKEKMANLRHLVEDDGPMTHKQGVMAWPEPKYSDAAPTRLVFSADNAHASPPSSPFPLKDMSLDTFDSPVRFTERAAHVHRHHDTSSHDGVRNTVLAQTHEQTRTRREGIESEEETQQGQKAINLGSVLGAVSSAVSSVASAVSSVIAPTQAKPEDIEDCVACRYVWLQVEMDVGNSQIEANIYDSFKAHCRDAQLSRIFYPACQDMFDAIDDMIGDYMDGFTVNQMCENSRICR